MFDGAVLNVDGAADNPDTRHIDLVITLGGDGTILHASSLFKTGAVPPVLSFSMGTLGFLLPFRTLIFAIVISHSPSVAHNVLLTRPTDIDDFSKAIEAAFEGKAMVLQRMRLSTTFYNAEGAVTGDRGGRSSLNSAGSSP